MPKVRRKDVVAMGISWLPRQLVSFYSAAGEK
jgi:hypothetical protein